MNPLTHSLFHVWDNLKQAVDQELNRVLEQEAVCAPLQQAMLHAALQGGKRLRPLLMKAVAHLLGTDFAQLLPIAAAVECVHAYSLAHDDLPAMDNAPLRRGQPSCWKQFDEATAILAGDALLPLAFQTLTEGPYEPKVALALIKTLATASGACGMVAGQMLDMHPPETPTLDHSITLQNLKTGELIAFCCVAPAIVMGESVKRQEDLRSIGLALGLLYQVVDDLLDHASCPEILGKPTQSDGAKSTFVTLLGAKSAWLFVENQAKIVKDKIADLNAPGSPHLLLDILQWMQTRKH